MNLDRCRRGIDRPTVAKPCQQWQPAGVIQVRMRHDNGIEVAYSPPARQPVMILEPLLPLKQTEIHQHIGRLGLHQISRARDLTATCAMNCNFHAPLPFPSVRVDPRAQL